MKFEPSRFLPQFCLPPDILVCAIQSVAGKVYHKVITTSCADTTAGWLVGNRRETRWTGKSICRRHSSPYPWYTVLLECGAQKLSRYSDSIQAERFGVRSPVGTRFSATVQAGPGTHPTSCIMGTGSSPRLKRTVCGVGHPPLTAPRLKKK
jgi:hypothetical protein